MTKRIPVALLMLATACNTPSNEPAAVATEPAAAAPAKHDYGIKAGYSSDFAIGDPAQGDIIIKLWKQFDENKLTEGKDYFADSVTLMFPGYVAKLSRDSMTTMMIAERGMASSMATTIDAIIPVKANDKDESAVCIWGKETSTVKGKEQKREIHEVWIFNKAGKITTLEQYVR
jgi:hypothetical protein